MQELPTPLPFEVLVDSICYHIGRYALDRDPALAEAVAKHLAMLPEDADCRSAILAEVGQRLLQQWGELTQSKAAGH